MNMLSLRMFTSLKTGLTEHSWFNDKRLNTRLGIIVEHLGNNIGSSIPQSSGNHGQTQAFYRFMNNSKVTPTGLYQGAGSELKERLYASEGQTFLAVSDTTSLNYTGAKGAKHLDCLDSITQKGVFCQTLMLMDASGCPMGLVRQGFHNRPAETLGQSRSVSSTIQAQTPIEVKESYRWLEDLAELETLMGCMPQHKCVHLIDSEGDIFELFAARRCANVHILTRSHHDRRLVMSIDATDNAEKKGKNPMNLKEFVRQTAVGGHISLEVRDDITGEKRQAQLEVRWTKVTLDVPQTLKTYQKERNYVPQEIYAVEVQEITPITAAQTPFKPLNWLLMTTLPVESLEQALEIVHFYTLRWRIEDFHVVLKEGCKIENLQLETAHALKNTIVTYSIVAIQVLRLRYLSQTQPDKPMQIMGLPCKAYQVVAHFLKKVRKIKIETVEKPTIKQFYQLITLLGTGNVKNTGVRALWRGIRDFNIIWDTFNSFNDS